MKTGPRVIIPCYNESAVIGTVIRELAEVFPESRLLVIDDGSPDLTSVVAEQTQRADVIRLPVNLGVGGAVQTGLIYADQQNDAIAVKFDGDGQHDPNYINVLLTPIREGYADIVIGSRFLVNNCAYRSTFFRRIGIKILELVCYVLTGNRITDPTSGLRAYNRKAIHFMARYYPSFDYPEPEEIILASRNNLKVIEVPVMMRARQAGISSISSGMSVYFMLKVTLAMIFISLRNPELKEGS